MTPQEQTFLRAQPFGVDVGDGEAQDERPDEAEDDLPVAIDDVFGADVGKLDGARADVCEGEVDVLEALDAQFWGGGVAAEGLIAEDFEEVDEYDLYMISVSIMAALFWCLKKMIWSEGGRGVGCQERDVHHRRGL